MPPALSSAKPSTSTEASTCHDPRTVARDARRRFQIAGVVVTNADVEPGKTIARTLADAGMTVSLQLMPGVDALVNSYRLEPNAAGAVEDLELDHFMRGVSTNLTDTFFASQAAAAQMVLEGRRGCIVNVTSVAGVVGLPGQS